MADSESAKAQFVLAEAVIVSRNSVSNSAVKFIGSDISSGLSSMGNCPSIEPDRKIIVNFALNVTEPTEAQFYSADINSDGVIDILDIVNIINIILG